VIDVKIVHFSEVEAEEAYGPNVRVRWLISKFDGAPTFEMRYFEVDPGASTPYHSHDWEHEVFILEGRGIVKYEETEHEFGPGYAIFIPPNKRHCFINTGETPLKFICLIPKRKD